MEARGEPGTCTNVSTARLCVWMNTGPGAGAWGVRILYKVMTAWTISGHLQKVLWRPFTSSAESWLP